MRETLLLDVPHRQVVFTIPKRLRVFFKFDRRLLGDLCRCALRSLSRYFEAVTGSALTPGVIAAIQTFGDRINLHVHLHFLVTEGGVEQETMDYLEFIARVTSHIPDKGQVMVRYYGLYANAHRGKAKKASLSPSALRVVEEELRRLPSKGWAALIQKPHIGLRSAAIILKVYEVDPMICSKCGGRMKVVAFLTEVALMASMRAAVPCFYRSRPTGGRRERGILLNIL